MTHDHELDARARAWLEEMPDRAPERTVSAVLVAIESTPQVGARLLIPSGRGFRMTRLSWAIVAILVAVVAGGTFIATRESAVVIAGPSPTPPLATSSPASTVAPPEMLGRWLGGGRGSFPVLGVADGTYLIVRSDALLIAGRKGKQIAERYESTVSVTGRVLDLAAPADGDCGAGQTGSYRWSLSPGATVLTIETIGDACADRSSAIEGTWYREACMHSTDWCLGDLEGGQRASWTFTTAAPYALRRPRFGELSYTVPDGWSNTSDGPAMYWLEPTDWYHRYLAEHDRVDTYDRLDSVGIYVLARPAAVVIGERSCAGTLDRGVGSSIDDLIAWIGDHPELDATAPRELVIGDRAATAIDVAIAPGSTATCPDLAGRGAAVLFTAADGSSEAGDYDWGIVEGARSRYIFIELGEERSVLVDISAPTEEFEEFVGRAMEVVGTFHFE